MKYGSGTNMFLDSNAPQKPEVGMGCTVLSWTDRNPATIVSVSKTGKSFQFTYDSYKRIDNNGLSEVQAYEYTPRPDGAKYTARLTQSGRYKCHGQTVLVGEREKYDDPHF